MHVEDYVHRIGRTGRANAIGDAISFVTPEDHGELRALERFIGRGLVRKRAEGFNYSSAAPATQNSGQQHPSRPSHQNASRGPKPQGQEQQSSARPHSSNRGQQPREQRSGQRSWRR